MQTLGLRFPEILLWSPLIAGLLCFILRNDKQSRNVALGSSLITLAISIATLFYANDKQLSGLKDSYVWLPYIGSSFSIGLDGMGHLLTFLTALSFPIIFIATSKTEYKNASSFYGLMLLSQTGLLGVFMAMDALVFYFFWELALIPVYFLSSRWGGERRIQATFKFFVYTFAGSLLMLVGIIYIYLQTPATQAAMHSFSINAFYSLHLSFQQQYWLFWLFFVAFAIKMPVFPFHTWQPDAYEQAPTAVTMVMSGIMVKMGVFALLRWLVPYFPEAMDKYRSIIIWLSVIGMLYASLIAMKQDDIKRLVAYSSIAHIGLMCAAIFTSTANGVQGVMIQMFSHGINIIGMWIVVELLERQTGVRKISQLGGVAHKAPVLTIMLVVIAFANIALPLTNAFIGEFMMFNGLSQANIWYAAVAGISIILGAVYTLNMVQKVFYGETNTLTATIKDINWNEKLVLAVVVIIIFIVGVYPQPIFDLTKEAVTLFATKGK
ncbi:MAG: NADH-quinone oxidoreductase subunit M [Bacteroidetes bacterium]|nr:NADH-quinone oxidoreductase subunit M [Bacteroidota bacterium]